ncbi:hypothetical protein ACED96_05480 [Clostridium thermobutyricum]|uniref:hypothetical protein n=1 Tax=uncultured Clostridium sp. TaxID=59620 RepID=UPI00258EAE86|nr:hypothetical protein [uncultured Clostridium sp.]
MLIPDHSSVEININKPTKAIVLELNEDLINIVAQKINYNLDVNSKSLKLEKPFINSKSKLIETTTERIIETVNSKDIEHKEFLIDLYAQ